jgi:hypothetical protein
MVNGPRGEVGRVNGKDRFPPVVLLLLLHRNCNLNIPLTRPPDTLPPCLA